MRASLGFVSLLLLGCTVPDAPKRVGPSLPLPAGGEGDEGVEERNRALRAQWLRQMKRAAPDVDVNAADETAGRAQMARRARLRVRPPAELGSWTERGSSNQAGRTHVVREVDDMLLVGTSSGGLWRGTHEATDWTPLGDNLYGGVHFLEVLDDTTPVILTATDGGYVHRSVDDGATWTDVSGLGSPWGVRRLLKTNDGRQVLFLVTGDDAGYHLYRSDDLGENWEMVYDFGGFGGDAWLPRTGEPGLWIAASDGVYRSDDDGDSWTQLSSVEVGATRAEIVGSEAGAPRPWVMRDAVLARSDDAGSSWVEICAMSDYWSDLNASIVDPDLFTYGGVELHVTRDAGATFAIRNGWGDYYGDPASLLHADIDGIDVVPDGEGETWYVDTDGGSYRSVDALVSVENLSLSGLRISQYYGTLTSTKNPNHVAAGAQDQGYQVTNTADQDGDDVYEFTQALSGDYGHLTSADGSHDFVYSVYPGFILVQVGERDPWLGYGDFPSDSYVPWLPPIVADPDDPLAFYFPATRLYRYTFDTASGYASGQLYNETNFSSDGYEYLSVVRFAPGDSQRMYAATSYGRFFFSIDKGVTWTRSTSLVPDENWYYGQAIAVSATNPDVVTVGGSGYGVPGVYRSEDGGATFRPWADGLPDTLVYALCEAPDGSGRVAAGTQTSVYVRGPADAEWVDVTDNTAPITTYWSCEALTTTNSVRFATYGRGIWDYTFPADPAQCYPIVDGDGDGVDCRSDCDDTDATVLPGAMEACDGIEVSCDPTDLDEGDADGDGALACADCDDRNAAVYPGASEVCGNSIDEDCDGAAAECAAPEKTPEKEEETGGCGCAAQPKGASLGAILILAAFIRRRRA